MSDRTTTIDGSATGAYDEAGRILYAIGPDGVTRWSVETGAFLTPIPLVGQLSGVAVSPDGRYLVVGAVDVATVEGVRVAQLHRIDLETLQADTVNVPLTDSYEGGVASVAISAAGDVLFTTQFYGSGWTVLRSFGVDDATPVAAPVPGLPFAGGYVRGASSLIASPDGSRILLLENGVSFAPTGVYDSAEARIVAHANADHQGYMNDGRGDISNDGRIAIITYGTVTVHDASMDLIIDLGPNDIGRYTDARFSHDGRHLFLFNQATDRIEMYDTTSWQLIGAADPGVEVMRAGNGDPVGDLELIDDGRLMLLTTASGVRVVDLVSRLTTETSGTQDGDILAGTVGRDTLAGLDGADTLSGGLGDDTLLGGDADDSLSGGLGDDVIDGGAGHDILTVSGAFSDYRLLMSGDDFILKGPDGGDRLTGVETVRFSDGRVLELNRMYGPGVDSGAWAADGRIPEALLSDGPGDSDEPLVLPGPGDAGLPDHKGEDGPQVLPGAGETRSWSGLEARLARHGDPMLMDERGGPDFDPGGDAFVLPGAPDGEPLVLPRLETFKAGDEPQVLPGTDPAALPFLTIEARPPFAGDGTFVLDPDDGMPDGTTHPDWM